MRQRGLTVIHRLQRLRGNIRLSNDRVCCNKEEFKNYLSELKDTIILY